MGVDFFTAVIKNIKEELFEGNTNRLVPVVFWGRSDELIAAGAAVPYSILLGGPGFPSFHSSLYSFLAMREADKVKELPFANDIPLNAATEDMSDFIGEV